MEMENPEIHIPGEATEKFEVTDRVTVNGEPGYTVIGLLPEKGKALVLKDGASETQPVDESALAHDTGKVVGVDLLNDAEVFSKLNEADQEEIQRRKKEREGQQPPAGHKE